MSKYEMTQAQWTRLVGHNPSRYVPGSIFGDHAFVLDAAAVNLLNPVEQVSWDDCETWMGRLGFVIPTEAQWEYAARGGTTTPRWTGATIALAQAANLADAFCKQSGGPLGWVYESWSDGFAVHAPVGSLAPNPFGLHDVLGNVWEWCRDGLGSYELPPRPGDGLRPPRPDGHHAYRGGSFTVHASHTRSAFRYGLAPGFRHFNLGIRPARRLDL
jgi:formylglycine-generating enzyme required for sulfatase activity